MVLRKELDLAGALKLKVDCLANIKKLDPSDYEELMDNKVGQLWQKSMKAGLSSITLQRVDNLGPEDPNGTERYVIVYRMATLGADPHCSLFFEDRGLEPIHVAFVYMNSRFYLENMTELTTCSSTIKPCRKMN